jgi:hypothetical protein
MEAYDRDAEPRAYAVSNAAYQALVDRIKARAQKEGWTCP